MKNILDNFQLSQTSLQSFVDCHRKFKLRYLENLAWPAPPTEPLSLHEEQKMFGERFHLLARQYFSGIPVNQITRSIRHPQLIESWENFLAFTSALDFQIALPEYVLSIPLKYTRLVAKYDLIIRSKNHFHIFDWKTSKHLPGREVLDSRMQTLIYPYVFLRAAPEFFEIPHLESGQIHFTYWFALHPEDEMSYHYTDAKDNFAERYIQDLEEQIFTKFNNSKPFEKTDDLDKCKFCKFRSHCARGEKAGNVESEYFIDDQDQRIYDPIEFERIAEINY